MIQISYIKPDGHKYCQFVCGRRDFVNTLQFVLANYKNVNCKYYSCY